MPPRSSEPPGDVSPSREALSALVGAAPVAMALIDRDGVFRFANTAAVRLLGSEGHALTGHSIASFALDDFAGPLRSYLARFWQQAERWPVEAGPDFPLRRSDGRELRVQIGLGHVRWNDQAMAVAVLHNVTERKGVEQALRDSEETLATAFRASPDAISVTEIATGRFIEVNEGYERISGYKRVDLIGRTSKELGLWADPDQRKRMLEELERSGVVSEMPVQARTRNGEIREFLMSAEKVEIGGRGCLVIVSRDLTTRLQSERALRESEEKFAAAFRVSPDIMSITDYATGAYIDVNEAHERTFGMTRAEAIGKTPYDLGMIVDPAIRAEMLRLLERDGRLRDYRVTSRNRQGAIVELIISSEFVQFGGKRCLLRVSRDITAQIQAERALRESEEKFSKAFRASPFPLTISELATGRYLDVNRGFEVISGYTRQEVIGRTSTELDLWLDPGDRERLVQALTAKGSVRAMEIRFRRRDGRIVTTRSSCELLEIGGVACLLNTIEDITDLRRTELEKASLENQLRQSQKLEALGTLAGGIAHDFNNILTAMVIYRELAMMDLDRPDEVRKHLAEIKQATSRAKELVRQILTFSRQQKQERRAMRLHPVVNEALRLLRSSLPATIELVLAIDEQAPEVLADGGQVHQVVMNLATNAAQAIRDRPGRIAVELSARLVDEDFCRSRPKLRPGLYAELIVTDNGHGMDENTLAHVFEPFFTTKAPGEGTGLGLAVVHGIMEDHDGAIAVRSRPGEGTTFELYFPQYVGAVPPAAEADLSAPAGRGESVLLVDDEPPLCEAMGSMLRRFGYRVTAFTDPGDAVAAFAAAPEGFDLLLTDHTMPRLTGLDLIREIHARRPNLPVILISGLTSSWTPEKLRGLDIRELVSKPVDLAGLAQAVRRALDSHPATPVA